MVYHYLMEASPSDFSLLWISLPQSSWTTVHSLQMVSYVSVLVFQIIQQLQTSQENKEGHNVKCYDKSSTYNETVLGLHTDSDPTSPEPRSSRVITYLYPQFIERTSHMGLTKTNFFFPTTDFLKPLYWMSHLSLWLQEKFLKQPQGSWVVNQNLVL